MQLPQDPLHLDSQPAATDFQPHVDNSSDEVIIVDLNDVPIGTAPKLEAHRNGLRHRAISVVIGDQHGRGLLHRQVSDWCWKPFPEVEREVDERPEVYTVWFLQIRHDFWPKLVMSLNNSPV